METDTARQLEDLFHEVGEAHHKAYIETDGADPEWPLWYADYLRERLGALLHASFTKGEIIHQLVLVASEEPYSAAGANWARYTTPRRLSLFTHDQGSSTRGNAVAAFSSPRGILSCRRPRQEMRTCPVSRPRPPLWPSRGPRGSGWR